MRRETVERIGGLTGVLYQISKWSVRAHFWWSFSATDAHKEMASIVVEGKHVLTYSGRGTKDLAQVFIDSSSSFELMMMEWSRQHGIKIMFEIVLVNFSLMSSPHPCDQSMSMSAVGASCDGIHDYYAQQRTLIVTVEQGWEYHIVEMSPRVVSCVCLWVWTFGVSRGSLTVAMSTWGDDARRRQVLTREGTNIT